MEKKLVPCDRTWWDFVRELRTDPRVAEGFFSTAAISPEVHEKFMTAHHQSYRICLVDGRPAGFVGVVDGDIRVCTHPEYQRQGVGVFMLSEFRREFPEGHAKIKVSNAASRRLFEKAGYRLTYLVFEP